MDSTSCKRCGKVLHVGEDEYCSPRCEIADTVAPLRAELEQARAQVAELEAEREQAQNAKLLILRVATQKQDRIKELEAERDAAMSHVEKITTGTDDLVNGVSTLCAIIDDYRDLYQRDQKVVAGLIAERDAAYTVIGALLDYVKNGAGEKSTEYELATTLVATLGAGGVQTDKDHVSELVSAARFVLRTFTGKPFDRGEYAEALNSLVTAMKPQEFEGTFKGIGDQAWGGGLAPLDATKRAEPAAHDAQTE